MEVKVYDGERFERTQWWYITFVASFVLLIIASFVTGNISGIIVLFLMLGGYLLYSIISLKKVTIKIRDEGLKIGSKFFPWENFYGFALELDEQTESIKNIVFVTKNANMIHTLADEPDTIKQFVLNLNDKLQMLSDFEQGFAERLGRKLKI
ncbi:hypothetical protein [Candidatus Absconditicoccus praedator]|uniref:hypothetical protein n=1 Tax=Candidatus Absconditicoccus praedator TaxID=2735562 RepID=UPI001E40F439|nr:hypothetical protein [Candidatus Absconditicoccus praedator]UFX82644.1 hypothetical protein HLG78_00635 [Candidatus Absconditicoccus praedator]